MQSDDTWKGFKIVGDNVDKNVRARHQTLISQNQSLHYFHAFAVMDRVDLSGFSDTAPSGDVTVDVTDFLPSQADIDIVLSRFKIFITR